MAFSMRSRTLQYSSGISSGISYNSFISLALLSLTRKTSQPFLAQEKLYFVLNFVDVVQLFADVEDVRVEALEWTGARLLGSA